MVLNATRGGGEERPQSAETRPCPARQLLDEGELAMVPSFTLPVGASNRCLFIADAVWHALMAAYIYTCLATYRCTKSQFLAFAARHSKRKVTWLTLTADISRLSATWQSSC